MDDATQRLFERVSDVLKLLEGHMHLPEHFLGNLLIEDNDWSFIIKLHALLEAAVTHHLVAETDPRLRPIFERLELSDPRAGKVAFARNLELLTGSEQTFVQRLSELRNKLVHNPRNVTFDLQAHVAEMDANQRRAFQRNASCFYDEDKRGGFEAFAVKEPRAALWLTALQILVRAVEASVRADAMRGLREAGESEAAESAG